MKPLYWKFLLIFGAMLVGASLVIPKALRKNDLSVSNSLTQTQFVLLDVQDVDSQVHYRGKTRGKAQDKNTETVQLNPCNSEVEPQFHQYILPVQYTHKPNLGLSSGTRPIKLRVVDYRTI